jgi:hypothetical protein
LRNPSTSDAERCREGLQRRKMRVDGRCTIPEQVVVGVKLLYRGPMRRLLRCVGVLLLLSGSGSCLSEEAQCHQRAMALLGCCPFCDASCTVSSNPDAKWAEESCLADLAEQERQAGQGEGSSEDGGNDGGETSDTSLDPYF